MKSTETQVQNMYMASSEAVRSKFGMDVEKAASNYRRYAEFVANHVPFRDAKILDLGCGGGWSTWVIRQLGHDAQGLDLHSDALEARSVDPGLRYTQGDIQALPFADASFDVASLNNVLEHVPDPERALSEMARIVRPGGRLIVVGPHLLSFPVNLYWATWHLKNSLAKGRLWRSRTSAIARHPGGNTTPEALAYSVHHAWHTLRKLVGERPVKFLMRTPDSRPPFHADNDACYYCNPMDILNWAKARGDLKPVQWWADDRKGGRVLYPFLGGTWVVLEKRASGEA